MAATSTSPVKILLDLGIDLDNLSSEENYLSALMEGAAAIESATKGKGDGRSSILREEVVRVRKGRKAASPSKGMKFTLKKKNISAQKLLTSSKEAKAQTEGGGDLLVIKEKVVAIEALLGEQYKLQEENAKDAKQEAEKKRRSLKERLLEGSGKVFDGVKKATNTVLKPFKSVWENIIGFIKKIILGRVLMNILEWTSDPKNAGKIDSIFKFLGDWWPALLAAYLVFGNGLSKFVIGLTGKLVVLGAKLVATVIPALIKAAAAMGPWGVAALGVAAVGGVVLGAKALDGDFSNKERTDEEKEADKEKADSAMDMGVLSMNKGGTVPGSGNTDTVPAMLTPGEFVMSKGAVQRYGASTLAGMNAAAGGTNRPTLMGRYNEGGKVQTMSEKLGHTRGTVTDPKEKKAQEDYMLEWVNKERVEFLGLPPLDKLTYAQGVELTQMMGPGPKTKEESHTNFDFDNMIKTTTKSKSVDGKTVYSGGSVGLLTEEDKQGYLASNPSARLAQDLKDQFELDNLGASISASAKMNGGGLVQGYRGGGLIKGLGKLIKRSRDVGGSVVQSALKMSGVQNIGSNVTPPTTPNGRKVTTIAIPGGPAGESTPPPDNGGKKIPAFSASAKNSQRKIRTLGITL